MLNVSRVKKLIEQKGFSNRSFAKALSISEAGLYKILDSGTTKVSTINKMSELLKVEISELIEENNIIPEKESISNKRKMVIELSPLDKVIIYNNKIEIIYG